MWVALRREILFLSENWPGCSCWDAVTWWSEHLATNTKPGQSFSSTSSDNMIMIILCFDGMKNENVKNDNFESIEKKWKTRSSWPQIGVDWMRYALRLLNDDNEDCDEGNDDYNNDDNGQNHDAGHQLFTNIWLGAIWWMRIYINHSQNTPITWNNQWLKHRSDICQSR